MSVSLVGGWTSSTGCGAGCSGEVLYGIMGYSAVMLRLFYSCKMGVSILRARDQRTLAFLIYDYSRKQYLTSFLV